MATRKKQPVEDNSMYFAGIGSRRTPKDVLDVMTEIAGYAEQLGYKLRSGGCRGPDQAFERGIQDPANKEIYLPWELYEDHPSQLFEQHEEDLESVFTYHPKANILTRGVMALQARNYQIIMGPHGRRKKASFVACWTPDGCYDAATRTRDSGGTGQGIVVASSLDIPIFNLARSAMEIDLLLEFMEELSATRITG